MRKRGRKPDDPHDQEAKGFPGRRKTKTLRNLERMEREALRDAKLLASAGTGNELQALPVFLADPRLAAAQAIWRDYAPRLDRLHFLSTLDRHSFAMFCIYAAEFVLANRDILERGYSMMVTTVAGSRKSKSAGAQMPRLNPSVDRRDHAADMMLTLAAKFGFTPLDRLHLMRDGAHFDDETLFNRPLQQIREPAEQAPSPEPTNEPTHLIGIMGSFDSAPPGKPKIN